LNQTTHQLNEKIVIAGTTLWSYPICDNSNNMKEHIMEHKKHVAWLTETISRVSDKQELVILTHFLPTHRLIDHKYLIRGIRYNSWFSTNLEHLIRKPLIGWLCGHSHAIINTTINGVYCGINAYNRSIDDHNMIKFIDIKCV
jgi:hypothetical protein